MVTGISFVVRPSSDVTMPHENMVNLAQQSVLETAVIHLEVEEGIGFI